MFYRPNFCCHCGEKIIRARWTPLTSRRFCDFCAIEQKQHDLIPRAAAVALVLVAAAGFTAYLGSGDSNSATRKAANTSFRTSKFPGGKPSDDATLSDHTRSTNRTSDLSGPAPSTPNNAEPNSKQRPLVRNSSTETVYYCGAMTKKGNACTRRVKIPGRCWQHLGQPAMNPSRN